MKILKTLSGFAAILLLVAWWSGFKVMYLIAYGSFTILAIGISGTFGWLYYRQRRDLSLGMCLSWAGASVLNGFWYSLNLFQLHVSPTIPVAMALALYLTGAKEHLSAFQKTLDVHPSFMWFSLGGSIVLSIGLFLLFGPDMEAAR